jgi:hypothetical protein
MVMKMVDKGTRGNPIILHFIHSLNAVDSLLNLACCISMQLGSLTRGIFGFGNRGKLLFFNVNLEFV